MPWKKNEGTRNLWSNRINEQKLSNKSITQWCRENNISVKNFYRWKAVFNKDSLCANISKKSFLKIPVPSKKPAYEMEYDGFIFRMHDFEIENINKLLKVLKGI